MNLRRNVVVALCGVVLLAGGASFAAEARDDDATVTKPEPEPDATFAWELAMGFAGTVLDPSAMPLVFQSGEAVNVPGATGLTAPFGGASLRQLITAGPAWETRAIQSHVRFTLGLQKPYAAFRQGSIDADVDSVRVSPRSLSLWVVRFGLGGEYTFGRVTPFADVLGDVQLATAEVTVGGQPASTPRRASGSRCAPALVCASTSTSRSGSQGSTAWWARRATARASWSAGCSPSTERSRQKGTFDSPLEPSEYEFP